METSEASKARMRLMISSISCSTAFISLMASGTMAAMIHKSGRLSIPYGRLIYALSLSDVVQSFAILIAPFLIPKTQSAGFSLAMGNVHTCDFVGFILPFGSTAVCMYTCSLCIYYVCKLKLNMTDSVFYQKVEKKMHIFIIFYNTVFSAAGVATKSVNPATQMDFCHYSRKPWNCDRSFDCERGHYARFFTIFYGPIGTPLVCLVGIVACMAGVVWHVILRERVFLSNTTGKSSLRRAYDRMKAYLSKRNDETQQNLSNQQPNESDVHYIARIYRRETMMQAFLYVIVFLCTYGVSIYVAICNAIDADVSMILGLLFLFVYPLGGLFNVLVYSRPAILAFRLEHSNYSWCKAFSFVVMAGGANPNAEAEEAGGLCCLRRGKDDDAVSKASKIDLRHQGYAQDADKSFTQGGRGSKDKTSTEGDGSGDTDLVQSHNLSSTGLRRENPKPENSVLLNRNICESSDISEFGGNSKTNMSSLTLDIALRSDVIEPSAIATDAFQKAFARVRGFVGDQISESENDGSDQIIAISSNCLSGFPSVPNEDIEQNDSLKHAIDNSESLTDLTNQTRAVPSSSFNLSGFSDVEKSGQIESDFVLEDSDNIDARASGGDVEGLVEETDEDHDNIVVKEKSRCNFKSHASDLAPVGIAAHAFQRAIARSHKIENEKEQNVDCHSEDSDDSDDGHAPDEEIIPSGAFMANLNVASEQGRVKKAQNIVVADAFKKAFARAACRTSEEEESTSRNASRSRVEDFSCDLSTLMEGDGNEED